MRNDEHYWVFLWSHI